MICFEGDIRTHVIRKLFFDPPKPKIPSMCQSHSAPALLVRSESASLPQSRPLLLTSTWFTDIEVSELLNIILAWKPIGKEVESEWHALAATWECEPASSQRTSLQHVQWPRYGRHISRARGTPGTSRAQAQLEKSAIFRLSPFPTAYKPASG